MFCLVGLHMVKTTVAVIYIFFFNSKKYVIFILRSLLYIYKSIVIMGEWDFEF